MKELQSKTHQYLQHDSIEQFTYQGSFFWTSNILCFDVIPQFLVLQALLPLTLMPLQVFGASALC